MIPYAYLNTKENYFLAGVRKNGVRVCKFSLRVRICIKIGYTTHTMTRVLIQFKPFFYGNKALL